LKSLNPTLDPASSLLMPSAAQPDMNPFAEVTQFLFHEAELMDTHKFDEWLALWCEESCYWVPCNTEELDPAKSVSLIYENRDQLEDRVFRLKGRHAHAQSPRSRLMRAVSNIVIESASTEHLVVRSTFVLGEVRNDRQETLFGRSRHSLVYQSGSLHIREKKVFLLNNNVTMNNVTFLI
jgi:3-phenylpropionate/cinnamic acid dioxygenase small subunit